MTGTATDLPRSAVEALHAFIVGRHFSVFNDNVLAVEVEPNLWLPVSDADLALLHERALIRLDGDDGGVPTDVNPTEVGKAWLRRWCTIHRVKEFKLNLVPYTPPQE